MHYYIDGYNILFRTLRSHQSLQEAREALVDDLDTKASLLNIPMTIVFDAHYQEEDISITHYHNLEIIYSSHLQTADDLIIKILKVLDNPKSTTLVTSDNKLAWRARHLFAKTEKVEIFLEKLNRRYENKLKQHTAPTKTLKQTPLIQPLIKKETQPNASVEKCQDDYEQIFTSRFEEFEKKRISKNQPKQPLQKMKKKEKNQPQEKYLSDYDRWLKIFEKESGEDKEFGA
jgi:uncharacterized protein